MPVLLRVAYHGAGFSGCGPRAEHRTVLSEIVAALERAGGAPSAIEALSRTDAGVHALGQVVVLSGMDHRPLRPLLFALAGQLPPDLRPLAVAAVDGVPTVVGKTYLYQLDVTPFGDPMWADRSWRQRVDVARLNEAATVVLGRHDFAAFRRRGETRADLVRTVTSCTWTAHDGLLRCTIAADGFVYRLVRSLVGAMVEVGRGVTSVDDLARALAGEPLDVARQQAPARGLHLMDIAFAEPITWETGD